MKAVVLAAGEGRRLEPLTNRRPKPMLPVANRPILEHVVEAIAAAGIDEVVLVVGYKRDRIQTHFRNGEDFDVDVEYAIQDHQLGTGHAIATAESHVDGPFLVLNGDRLIDEHVVEAVAEALTDSGGPVVSVTRVREARNYGVVTLTDGRVTAIREKPPAYESTGDLINAGVYGFEPTIFDQVRSTETNEAGETEITATLDERGSDGGLETVRYQGRWLDVSYPWDLLTVNGTLLEDGDRGPRVEGATVADDVAIAEGVSIGPNTTIGSRVALGANVTVGSNVTLSNAVVLPDTTIDDGAVVQDAIVGENTTVGPNSTVVGGESRMVVEDEVHRDVRLGGVIGDSARIGGGVVLETGAVVGEDAHVASGARIDGRVPPNAEVHRG
ncbi:MAG: sugar phosphate nucleotidyltransferase [Halorientalis sp.]